MRRAAAVTVVAAVVVILVWPGHPEVDVTHQAWNAASSGGAKPQAILNAFNAVEVIGNVLLFVPVGFTSALASRRWWMGAVVGLMVSGACETAQIFIPARHASLGDVAANTAGATLGALVVLALRVLRRRSRPDH